MKPLALSLTDEVVQTLLGITQGRQTPLHEPSFNGQEWAYVKDCLDSTFVSSVGTYVNRFESELTRITGARHAVAVVNGTAALHLALLLAGVKPGDEVLVPAVSFVATANAVAYCQAKPHFVDSEETTLGMDARALSSWLASMTEMKSGACVNRRTGAVIRAIVPMHVFGHPSDMDALMRVAHDHRLVIVEDAAESLGSLIGGKHTGTLGALGTLSFNGNKTITTGGGGAILTNDDDLARKARHLSTTARQAHRWAFQHDALGFNYRMPNLNAALGCAQLEQLDNLVQAQRDLHNAYDNAFQDVQGVRLLHEPLGSHSNYWLQALILDRGQESHLGDLLEKTNALGILTRPLWTPLNALAHFSDCPGMPTPVAESLAARLVNIPSSPNLLRRCP